MKQKILCVNILLALAGFASLRAFWGVPVLLLDVTDTNKMTAVYNILFAGGAWLAYWFVKRIPVRH
jgi:hypothetical protein